MSILLLLKILHLAALAAGLGAVILADLALLRGAVLKPIDGAAIARVKELSRWIVRGLEALWVTGLALIAVRAAEDAAFLTSGFLWAKLAIVTVLTLNGIAVHRIVIPYLESREGQRLFDMDTLAPMAIVSAVAAISMMSWVTPAFTKLIGLIGITTPAATMLWNYPWAILAAWFGIMIVSILTMKDRIAVANAETQTIELFNRNPVLRRRVQQLAAGESFKKAA